LNVELFVGNGDGTFEDRSPVAGLKAYSGGRLAIADFNRDRNLDVAIQFYNRQGTPLALVTGNGDGTFLPPISLSFGLAPAFPLAADLNGDGLPDLVLPDVESADGQTYDVFVLINNTSSTAFTVSVTINGSGAGGVTIHPGLSQCTHSCSQTFASETQVTINEQPNSGSSFVG
jgi:hypothetical protein